MDDPDWPRPAVELERIHDGGWVPLYWVCVLPLELSLTSAQSQLVDCITRRVQCRAVSYGTRHDVLVLQSLIQLAEEAD